MFAKKIVKDSIIYGGADFLSKAIALVAFPIIASVLSPRSFGALELIFTSIALVGVVVNCGINNAVQRFYWDENSDTFKPIIVTTGLLLQLGFAFTAIIIGAGSLILLDSSILINDLPFSLLALFSALALIATTQLSQFILDVTRLHFEPWRFLAIALSARTVTVLVGVYAIVFMNLGIDGLLISQVLVYILILPFALFSIKRDLIFSSFSLYWAKEILKYGFPFIFAGLAYWLFNSMDRWMLSSIISLDEVGVYSVAARFSSIVLFLSVAFGQAFSPLAMKIRIDYPDEYRTIFGKILCGLLLVMLFSATALSLYAGEIVTLIMPFEYKTAIIPLILLSFGIVIQSAQQVVAVGISIEKQTHLFAKLAWAAAIINLIGNFLLIPLYGASGAAISTLFSYAFLSFAYLFFTQKLHSINIPSNFIFIIAPLFLILMLSSITYIKYEFVTKIAIFKLIALIILGLIFGLIINKYFKGINIFQKTNL